MTQFPFSDTYKSAPFWWEGKTTPTPASLPAEKDVLVIGSGYTGLHAAIQTARAGMSTVVIDAGRIGEGCSTRNGGQISTSIKPGFDLLKRKFGADTATRIFREGQASIDFTAGFVAEEGINCDFRVVG